MTKNENNVNTTTLANALVYNNRFATEKLNAEQLGVENFAQWKNLVNGLHREAYSIYAQCENSGMKVADTTVDKTPVYDAIRVILSAIGEVNEHKLYANEESAIAIISYAGKRGNVDAPELQFCTSRLNNRKTELKKAQEINGYNADAIKALQDDIAKLEEEKATLLATVDMRYKQPTMTSANAFRLDVEHYFARVIVGQMAKTLEQLDKEAEDRKKARQEKAKARKQAKAKATEVKA